MHGRPVLPVLLANPTRELPVALEDDEHDDTVRGKLIDECGSAGQRLRETTRPASASASPSRTAARKRSREVRRSNSSGESSTAAGLPFWVMIIGRPRARSERTTSEACALKLAIGRISSETWMGFMVTTWVVRI